MDFECAPAHNFTHNQDEAGMEGNYFSYLPEIRNKKFYKIFVTLLLVVDHYA